MPHANGASIDSSLAGVVVAETSLAWVDPVRGAFLRGYALSDLAEHHPYEAIAHVVMRGELPHEPSAWTEALARATLSPEKEAIARDLGRTIGCDQGLVAAMTLAGEDDWWLDPPAALLRILGRLPCVAAAVRGAPPPPPASYAERCRHALGATRADAPALRALEVLLSLETEHGLSASTFACRVAASSGASPESALAAATATLSGPRHGGATAEARALLRDVEAASDVVALVRSRRAQKLVFPGFGHRVYKGADPRLPPLRRAVEAMSDVPLRGAALAIERAVAEVFAPKVLHSNIDLWGAVLLDALGVQPEMYVAAFALGVGPGWLAHYEEQLATSRLIRPESAYVGPAERPVPVPAPTA
jgi:citrate synthase